MIESFFTIANPTTGLYKDKGSKFIAFAHPVTDSEQIKSVLGDIRKEYFDARHHCYAWVLGADKNQFKAFDDGEPNHTAGDPIYGQIRSKNLTDVLVVVVRYFGGVKLGVSGLIAAYKNAAADALDQALIIEKFINKRLFIQYEYADTTIIKNLIKDFDLSIIKESFDEHCFMNIDIKISKEESLRNRISTLMQQGVKIQIE